MRTKRTVVILISGKAQAGKSTTAELLTEKLGEVDGLNTMRYSFAEPLKFMANAFIGWKGEKDERGRKLLQSLGKDGREFDKDIWVKHLLNQMDKKPVPPHVVLVDDWRFPNEMEFLRKNPILDVITIRVFGRGGLEGEVANDASETALTEIDTELLASPQWSTGAEGMLYDFQINNSGDLSLLNLKLDVVLAQISKQYIVE